MKLLQITVILMILIVSVKSVQQQEQKELNGSGSTIEASYFSLLPFDNSNSNCSYGGFYGLGFTGLIGQCIIDPNNEEYNYKVSLQDAGGLNEQVLIENFNKSDTNCEGIFPYNGIKNMLREGACSSAPNFIGLKDTLVGAGYFGKHYLYDEVAMTIIGDMPIYAYDKVTVFALYNTSECANGEYYPTYTKSYSQSLELITPDGITYSYNCDNTSNLPQITQCQDSKCESSFLDNIQCSLVEGTENVYQQIFCLVGQ